LLSYAAGLTSSLFFLGPSKEPSPPHWKNHFFPNQDRRLPQPDQNLEYFCRLEFLKVRILFPPAPTSFPSFYSPLDPCMPPCRRTPPRRQFFLVNLSRSSGSPCRFFLRPSLAVRVIPWFIFSSLPSFPLFPESSSWRPLSPPKKFRPSVLRPRQGVPLSDTLFLRDFSGISFSLSLFWRTSPYFSVDIPRSLFVCPRLEQIMQMYSYTLNKPYLTHRVRSPTTACL